MSAASLPVMPSLSPYVAYTYSYPHKTAYRPLDPPRPLADVWAGEKRDALFLYLHVPFCEMRCGFCNLFTTANPRMSLTTQYVDVLERQARVVADALGEFQVARLAVGGGTPTYLEAADLERLMRITRDVYRVSDAVPASVETSPRTATLDRLAVLRGFGVRRISIGVQSFVESEVVASARAQTNAWVDEALQRIRDLVFPVLNLDLIYGLPGQTVSSWLASIQSALRWRPEELYLYPLYVRPLTGLDRRGCEAHDTLRLACYREGRDLLLAEGYEQVSMRMFRRIGSAAGDDPVYCCQADGMVGLGCGARSYTQRLHYSTDFAVGNTGVREIIDHYLGRSDAELSVVDYGCDVDADEYRRRWVIKSLFRVGGFRRDDYPGDVLTDFPLLQQWGEASYVTIGDQVSPTPAGLELSDALGPELFSPRVREMMADFQLR
jgi:oxygen-independent coproporphyrinogen-3 oxidase